MRGGVRSLVVLIGLAALAGFGLRAGPASATVVFDWVAIGDAGNAPDAAANCLGAGCGAVAYEFFVSRHEVTNAQYVEFLNAKAAADPLALYNTNMASHAQGGITRSGVFGSFSYAVKPGFENKPVNFVSFYDALRFTNWLGNGQGGGATETGAYTLLGGTITPSNGASVTRNPGAIAFLPSENEWYKAAYYDGLSASWFDYPTGSNAATVCAAPTATANRANCASAAGGLTDAGAYAGSASPYGTFDQGGNVIEWNEEIVGGTSRGIRGGSWSSSALLLAASFPLSGNPTNENDGFGFRVASVVPEPGTSLLVAIGLAALAARRRP
ncbi:MAG: PEP-CTERM sorting domain-containing protein [Proteobacteria bacterium]|nr:MAG: PEP-CTERM sorting domain-containing protein [Pseudomonadota bacterium]